MNYVELKELLEKEKISNDIYSLKGGLPNERYCIAEKKDNWEVYYSERGVKTDLRTFFTEEEACQHFYKRVKRML